MASLWEEMNIFSLSPRIYDARYEMYAPRWNPQIYQNCCFHTIAGGDHAGDMLRMTTQSRTTYNHMSWLCLEVHDNASLSARFYRHQDEFLRMFSARLSMRCDAIQQTFRPSFVSGVLSEAAKSDMKFQSRLRLTGVNVEKFG